MGLGETGLPSPRSGSSSSAYRGCKLTPFLKWAGGKRWLTESDSEIFPKTFDRYIEPFLGGAATFFHLLPTSAVLSDVNSELILTYQVVRDDWKAVRAALDRHQRDHSKKHYYDERKRLRRNKIERAARLLYLNRACWNGLYRVNLQGQFNVPKGTKKNIILSTDDFQAVSRALQNAIITSCDFEEVIDKTERNDFLFVDPPYTVKHNMDGFVKYNERIFTWDDQIRLAQSISKSAKRGAKILVTNADHEAVRELYQGTGTIKRLRRFSIMAGNKLSRGETTELAIMINYDPERERHA